MVTNKEVIDIARFELGTGMRKILVTGATGFVGSRLAQALVDAGHDVTITGRSPYRVRSEGVFVACDITDCEQVIELCKDQEIVFHCAALTSPWGSLELHRSINTLGTSHVAEGCLQHGVKRLVHVSSTAIFFQFKDRIKVTDNTKLPKTFCNPYAQSKAEAELVVQSAMDKGLNAYIVRARAVFGPGDNALLPRLIKAAEQGRIRQIGAGDNLCDLTYVDNLIVGLIKAANPDRPTGISTITNEEPVNLWNVLNNVLAETTTNPPMKSIPYWIAHRAAQIAEWKHRLLRLPGEPAITRYGIGLLAKQQTFESKSAKSDLDYSPVVKLQQGIDHTIQSLRSRIDFKADREGTAPNVPGQNFTNGKCHAHPNVSVKFFSTGFVKFKLRVVEKSSNREPTRFHATVAMIKHPQHGITLFDTGYSCKFYDVTKSFPNKLYAIATKVITKPEWSIESWLRQEGLAPRDVSRVLVSHFHADHIGGIHPFRDSDFIASSRAWDAVKRLKGFAAVKRGFLPELLPSDFESRLHTIGDLHSPGLGSLRNCHDLFGDGSVRLFDLDGHANGQMGALLRTNEKYIFLVADTFWTRKEIESDLNPTVAFRAVAENFKAAKKSRSAIIEIAKSNPEIEFVCTHCPGFASEQGFDRQLDS
ncbi:MAG: NAD-dependent epimerase/dehydratase family protein [Mariniblastus sp.]